MRIESKYIYFTLATIADAQFIYDLRKERGQYLHETGTIEDQINFLKSYKEKEKQQLEFYFIIHDKQTDEPLGCVRIYDIDKNNDICEWGSWILKQGVSTFVPLSSFLMSYYYIFIHLKLSTCLLTVSLENKKAMSFYEKLGSIYLNKTDLDMFFRYDKKTFEQKLKKYHKFVGNISITT